MAKTWKQIMEEMGRVPPAQTMKDKQDLLREKGLASWDQFVGTEEWMEQAKAGMASRFSSPDMFSNPKETQIK